MSSDANRKRRNDLIEYISVSEEQKQVLRERIPKIVKGNIPIDIDYDGSILEIYSQDRASYTHGFHKFPAKYIPEIPRWGILKFSKEGDAIVDPFCGSGTTNVEAILSRRNSYFIDVDPIALLLTKVKITPIDEKNLRKTRDWLIRAIYSTDEREIPDFPNRDYWFKPKVLQDLGTVTKCINSVENVHIRDFFRVCLSSILKEVSNADPKFLYALAISRKMREQKNRVVDVKGEFVKRVKELVPLMINFSKTCPKGYFVKCIEKDAREIELPDESIDLGVTSPPYCNAVDYPRANQLQIYWFGFWKGRLSKLKERYVGTENVPAKEYKELHKYGNTRLDEILETIYELDERRSYVVYRYFTDMRKNFIEMKRVLKPMSHYVVAVADNIVRKVSVPTHSILMDIAQEVGFEIADYFGSVLMMRPHDMRKSEKMKAEWVMAFRKGSQ